MKKTILPLALLGLIACSTSKTATHTADKQPTYIDGKLWASFFQQKAAEYKALCYQAYNIARLRLDESLAQNISKPRAIVTDLDETALDNSPYAVACSYLGKDYEASTWTEWTAKANADTLAGSVSFFNYAASKNVEVFYVTNRDTKDYQATLENLRKYGFPYADEKHLIVRTTTSSKEARRQAISATHEIIMLLGDNLTDFSMLFEKKDLATRTQIVNNNAAEFGKKFIVLPNTTYGDWEGALYNYNYKLTGTQKDSVLRTVLRKD